MANHHVHVVVIIFQFAAHTAELRRDDEATSITRKESSGAYDINSSRAVKLRVTPDHQRAFTSDALNMHLVLLIARERSARTQLNRGHANTSRHQAG
jgi:hypothetical protein